MHGRQAEAGSAADGLGGEEGLENVLQRGGIHAVAGIAHGKTHMRPGHQGAVREGALAGHGDVFERNLDRAAPVHGLRRIGAEVHHDLLQLGRIRLDRGAAGIEASSQRNGGGVRGANEIHGLGDDRLNAKRRGAPGRADG